MPHHPGQQRRELRIGRDQGEQAKTARHVRQQVVEPPNGVSRRRQRSETIDEKGQRLFELPLRSIATKCRVAALSPLHDQFREFSRRRSLSGPQPGQQLLSAWDGRPLRPLRKLIIGRCGALNVRTQRRFDLRIASLAGQCRKGSAVFLTGRDLVRLRIFAHLQAMFRVSQQFITPRQVRRERLRDMSSPCKCGQGGAGIGDAEVGISTAENQLLHLGEKLDFPDAAASALQIKAGTERLAVGIMIADAKRHVLNVLHRRVVERAAPNERADLA